MLKAQLSLGTHSKFGKHDKLGKTYVCHIIYIFLTAVLNIFLPNGCFRDLRSISNEFRVDLLNRDQFGVELMSICG